MKKSPATREHAAAPRWFGVSHAASDQCAAAADCATAMFSGFEAIRKVQEHAAHEAARRHASAAQRMKQGCGPAEVAAIQGDLLRSDLEGATQYWQQIAATAMEMQTRMLNAWNTSIDADTVLESLSALSGRPH